jgi:two-component system, chemotaxis family, chemotaxis protein CheY
MKILVVDDASFRRSRAVRIIHNEETHEVIEAANGREALEAWEAASPDVILLDISMPEIDGLETLK